MVNLMKLIINDRCSCNRVVIFVEETNVTNSTDPVDGTLLQAR